MKHLRASVTPMIALCLLLGESSPVSSEIPGGAPHAAPAAPQAGGAPPTAISSKVNRVVKVHVAALDQPFWANRLGANNPNGMIYALLRDVVPIAKPRTVTIEAIFDNNANPKLRWEPAAPVVRVGDTIEWKIRAGTHGTTFLDYAKALDVLNILPGGQPILDQPTIGATAKGTAGFNTPGELLVRAQVKVIPQGVLEVPFECTIHKAAMTGKLLLSPPAEVPLEPGQVALRSSKRPRPLTLRANLGDCLEIHLTNLLSSSPPSSSAPTRLAGIHLAGMELVDSIDSDASWVGTNPGATGSLAAPGETKVYRYYAREEGTFLIYSAADPFLGTGKNTQVDEGLFGAVNVQPRDAEWYRSQVTHVDLALASYKVANGKVDEPTIQLTPVADDKSDDPRSRQVRMEESAPIGQQAQPPQGRDARENRKRPYEMRIFDAKLRVPIVLKARERPDGTLVNETGHPIVNYDATFQGATYPDGAPIPDGTPVLKMIQAHKRAKIAAVALPPGHYTAEMRELEAGIIPPALVKLFADNGIKFSNEASVSSEEGYQWLIVDQARAFLVSALPVPVGNYQIELNEAELELVYSDLTAIITGPDADRFPYNHNSPSFRTNPAYPDRRQPYREFTIIYHKMDNTLVQAFPEFFGNPNLTDAYSAGKDAFAINYGASGIGAEIVANRVGVGPMGNPDAVDLKYEEFFLNSWACGDPAMIVDVPANCPGDKKANKVNYPDDPSNVYHSYMRDHVKFRILHAGLGPSHVHHLHAHQWLYSPNSDQGHYQDSQLIVPGSAYTLEITYGGSGNRNLTPGDSIFHCHFYPHFAQGMWSLWRVHDVFEEGTELDKDGRPKVGARALPDGELERGTPIPAVVPLPSLGMAPIPAEVRLANLAPMPGAGGQGRRAEVVPENQAEIEKAPRGQAPPPQYRNPGYPFYIPGVAGHRPPHPPLDFAWKENEDGQAVDENKVPTSDPAKKVYLDGGLPRHVVLGGTLVKEFHTRWDFSKEFYDRESKTGGLLAFRLPEEGTPVEQAAMNTHSIRSRPSPLPNGQMGNFLLNGLPATHGAPYANPSVDDNGNPSGVPRRYKAAVIQTDVVLNKKGWHYPQQRMLTLWGDIRDTFTGSRPPQPLFFRATTGDSIEFWHCNLVPSYYDLDDFQVRTPTDIIGQHIHLVKFDVTSSDGAANGFNYEDGTFSPDEVRDRIDAINLSGGLYQIEPFNGSLQVTGRMGYLEASTLLQKKLTVVKYKDVYPYEYFGDPPPGQDWDGAQTTIQRWDTDPLLNNNGDDRTLRTVFTHDHFGPSTHQQVGLYAGLLVEPAGSRWLMPDGQEMNVRFDGGPTSWQGVIVAGDQKDFAKDSFREFALEFQDTQLAYDKGSPSQRSSDLFDPTKPNASAAFDVGQVANFAAKIKAYTTDLDNGKVPDDFITGKLPKLGVFATFGVPLSKDAKATVKTKGQRWEIQEASTAVNPGETYVLAYSVLTTTNPNPPHNTAQVDSLKVYTPGVPPSWASHDHSLNSPGGANNKPANPQPTATFPNGPPYPQLVSSGQNGTYSVNYRQEPIPFRIAPTVTINAVIDPKTGPTWEPSSPTLQVGDVVEWRVQSGKHGTTFLDYAKALDSIEILDGGQPIVPQPTIGPAAQGTNGDANAGDLLVRARIKAVPAGVPEVPFECTVHKAAMTGKLVIQPGTTPASPQAQNLAYVYQSIRRDDPDLNRQPVGFTMPLDFIDANNPVLPPQPVPQKVLDRFAAAGDPLSAKATLTYVPATQSWVIKDVSGPTYPVKKVSKQGQDVLLVSTQVPGADWVFPPTIVPGVDALDPFTPLLRAYQGDDVQIRTLPGAHTQGHVTQVHGINWFMEPTYPDSGSRNAQPMGISQHFEMIFRVPPATDAPGKSFADYFYAPSSDVVGLNNGVWGIMRAYDQPVGKPGDPDYLMPLPNNVKARAEAKIDLAAAFQKAPASKQRVFNVTATTAAQALKDRIAPYGGRLVYNARPFGNTLTPVAYDPNAILFVRTEDLTSNDKTGTLKAGVAIEPLILRAAAGDWIQVNLTNAVDKDGAALKATIDQSNGTPWGNPPLPAAVYSMPPQVALHPALVSYDMGEANGVNVGFNKDQAVQPTAHRTTYWYAGNLDPLPDGTFVATPVEFGTINLTSADLQVQHERGLYGALVIEPEGSSWTPGDDIPAPLAGQIAGSPAVTTVVTKAMVTVTPPGGAPPFREFVAVIQNDSVYQLAGAAPGQNKLGSLNYRNESFATRTPVNVPVASFPLPDKSPIGFARTLANSQVNGDPVTPLFQAKAGTPVRFRVAFPGGASDLNRPGVLFEVTGHVWQDEPYAHRGLAIGNNPWSNYFGMQQILPYEAYNLVLPSAGGSMKVPGDYLYNTFQLAYPNGTWGLFRVTP